MRPTRYVARWVVPVTSAPLRDAAVLVGADGCIAAVGPTSAVPVPDDGASVDLGEAAILPGFVNTHAHPDLAFLRGCIEDRPFPDWIASLLDIRRNRHLRDEDFVTAARWSCAEMLAAGVTAIGATEDSEGAFIALRESGQRGIVFREVFGPDPDLVDESMVALRTAVDGMRPHETDRVRVGVSPHSPISVSDRLFAAVARYATGERLPVAIHTAESQAERDLVENGAGEFARRLAARGIDTTKRARSTVELLEQTGVLDASPLLIHCVTADAGDIERIAASGSPVVHCPIANARLGHGVAPVFAMRAAGITVALGTDSVASNNRIDMLEEARTAQLLQRATMRSATALPASDVLRMATLDGARALGLDGRTGALAAGLDADLCVIRLDGTHVRPVHDPVTAIVHSARASDVALTVGGGRVLYRDGTALTIDVEAAGRALDALAARVRDSVLAATARHGGERPGREARPSPFSKARP